MDASILAKDIVMILSKGWAFLMLCTCVAIAAMSAPARADTYAYDQFGRIICVAFMAGGRVTYTYDDAGNRSQKVDSTSGSCP